IHRVTSLKRGQSPKVLSGDTFCNLYAKGATQIAGDTFHSDALGIELKNHEFRDREHEENRDDDCDDYQLEQREATRQHRSMVASVFRRRADYNWSRR